MSNDTANTIDNEVLAANSYRQMVDYLENILTRQVERLRAYDLDGAMALAEEADTMAANIAAGGIIDTADYAEDKRRLEKIYKDLNLIIASERSEVFDKLKQIRTGIKTLGIYKGV